ncbi:hypothetical protein XENOCAPTIV_017332, partial [Xenoophorus captivus]
DHSRVVLSQLDGHLCSDYINASFIDYSFIYQALLEYYLYGDTELDVCSLESHLQRLHNTRAPHDRLGLEEEFRVRRKSSLLNISVKNELSPIILHPTLLYYYGNVAQGAALGGKIINKNVLDQLKLYKAPPSAALSLF